MNNDNLNPPDNLVALHPELNSPDTSESTLREFTDLVFSRIRHPSGFGLHGEALANVINDLFIETDHVMEGAEEESIAVNHLVWDTNRIIDETGIYDDNELYERKKNNDSVFSTYIDALQTGAFPGVEHQAQRKAALQLLELRGSMKQDSYHDDTDWVKLLERLIV